MSTSHLVLGRINSPSKLYGPAGFPIQFFLFKNEVLLFAHISFENTPGVFMHWGGVFLS